MVKSNLNVKITRDLKMPESVGVHYRLLCMTGKNKGISYYLKGKRAILGRSDAVDVQVLDTKSSREHAELTLHANKFVLTDLGSQNGVIVNDLKVNQHTLEDGDKIIIGTTVYKYNVLKVETNLSLVDPETEVELFEEDSPGQKKKNKKKSVATSGMDRKKVIYGVVGLLVMVILFSDGEKKVQQPTAQAPIRDASTPAFSGSGGVKTGTDLEQEKKLNAVLHRGLREFREANYFRAIAEFNFALLMSPNHGRASFYLNRTKQRLDEEIETNFSKARQEVESLRYDAAIVSFCSVIRLLRDYPEDERYVMADKEINVIKERMGYMANEDRCFSRQ